MTDRRPDTVTYESPNRGGVVAELGDDAARYIIYDPRPMRRDAIRIAIASVLASVGLLLLLPIYLRGYYGMLIIWPYLPITWALFAIQLRRILARRKHGCPPTMIEASQSGLRLAYFNQAPRDVIMPAKDVRAVCVRRLRKAGANAWFWGFDVVVEGWGYYRLVFVATTADVPGDMVWNLTWKLGFGQMLPEPQVSTQIRPLNTAE